MNDKQIDALLEQMKQRGKVARQGERSADEFLAAFRTHHAVRPKLALKTALAALLVLASLGYCFHAYTAWQAEKASANAQKDVIPQMHDTVLAAKAPLAPQKSSAEKKYYEEMDSSKMTISSPREKWHFLPCFGNDVRGVEVLRTNDGHFHDAIPPSAEMLLAEGKLTDSQREDFHWHSVNFPHRDFNRIMPQNNNYGWYGCEFDVPDALN